MDHLGHILHLAIFVARQLAELDGSRGEGWDDGFAGKQVDELVAYPLFIRSLTGEVTLQAIGIGRHTGLLPRLGLVANEKGLSLVVRQLKYLVGDGRRIVIQFVPSLLYIDELIRIGSRRLNSIQNQFPGLRHPLN